MSAAFVSNGIVGGALIVAMVNVPLFTNIVMGGSALDGGLNLMRLTVALPFGALAGGYVATRYGYNARLLRWGWPAPAWDSWVCRCGTAIPGSWR